MKTAWTNTYLCIYLTRRLNVNQLYLLLRQSADYDNHSDVTMSVITHENDRVGCAPRRPNGYPYQLVFISS